MPVMHVCNCPEKFPRILLYAFITLISVYCLFANLVYMTLGPQALQHPFITQDIDQKSTIVIVLNLLFCTSLFFTYAIFIYPANNIIEEYLLHAISKKVNK